MLRFGTDHGTVTAAADWDAPAERKRVWPALAGSSEELFHETALARFMLNLWKESDASLVALRQPRLQRVIGVIYRPETYPPTF